ncbi:MAG TPA: NTP transferase domain-containing protein, partial [Candidatus Acidoferrum sp.]|nr:NTP transferase domain-containing protein [Candidatus Acidoferrum sp.]
MRPLAILMAGGRSERMRASAGPRHKALIEVGGMTLIERNLRQLLGSGLRDLIVVIADDEPELEAYVYARLLPLALRRGATLTPAVERTRLGNIGFVGQIGAEYDDVLVVYVDNLCTLDVRDLLDHHICVGADLTFAVHREGFAIPYGMLDIADGRIRAYREKPVLPIPISSGTCVVGERARRLVPLGERVEACRLFVLAERAGLSVAAYEHDEPWVDVND